MPVDGIGSPAVEVDSGPVVEIGVEVGREIGRLQKKDKAVSVVAQPVKQRQRVEVDGDSIERVVEAEAGGEAEPEPDDEGEGEKGLCWPEDGIAG